jgi:hypothetical protein
VRREEEGMEISTCGKSEKVPGLGPIIDRRMAQ